ncbi:hypothetical protein [Streptomyces melanogenes]|uniref:hypothetical protein n=1 Tax=Streptomyces melanogenes TaxID=67326 RepID=UPI00378B30D6
MTPSVVHQKFLYLCAALGFAVLVSGLAVGVLTESKVWALSAVVLESLGSAVLFPILVSFSYDRLKEKWLGDEVWRIFNELSDAGISRVYKDRELSPRRDNAQTRLSEEFRSFENGEILMMGVSLRVFFNPLGPFYRDIETMLRETGGRVRIRAVVCDPANPDVPVRAAIEEAGRSPEHTSQLERDIESTRVTVAGLRATMGPHVDLRLATSAPYCTTVIFPHVCYYSPNLLAPKAPVGLPMILFRSGAHGFKMIQASFEYVWQLPTTRDPAGR